MEGKKEVWRPTVRYNPAFEDYVNKLFHTTTLDRNQLLRLALFCAPFSGLFKSKVEQHMKAGGFGDCPKPSWKPADTDLWLTLGGESDAAAEGKEEGQGTASA